MSLYRPVEKLTVKNDKAEAITVDTQLFSGLDICARSSILVGGQKHRGNTIDNNDRFTRITYHRMYSNQFVDETMKNHMLAVNYALSSSICRAWLTSTFDNLMNMDGANMNVKNVKNIIMSREEHINGVRKMSGEMSNAYTDIVNRIADCVSAACCVTMQVGNIPAINNIALELGKMLSRTVGNYSYLVSEDIATKVVNFMHQSEKNGPSIYVTSVAANSLVNYLNDIWGEAKKHKITEFIIHLPAGLAHEVFTVTNGAYLNVPADLFGELMQTSTIHDKPVPIDGYFRTTAGGPELLDLENMLKRAMTIRPLHPSIAYAEVRKYLHNYASLNFLQHSERDGHKYLAWKMAIVYWALLALCGFSITLDMNGALTDSTRLVALTILRSTDSLARQALGDFSNAGDYLKRIKVARTKLQLTDKSETGFTPQLDMYVSMPETVVNAARLVYQIYDNHGRDVRDMPFWVYMASKELWEPSNEVFDKMELFKNLPKVPRKRDILRNIVYVMDDIWSWM